ncbi:uncharacterized protein KGF55_004705 [Candida pseudojiufengensis]|uniref:uncharacterized protein n=1 Tax=Candida pseudojiufengensis TaxID=497109 RepID=UPI0022251F2D|nr:uncharacterized protein KGF55_004705 [Candida pseudojiufengensis]KAI5960413.1 hypothetical protein KGF55_004705 [Candida pseudojiufengensis]
MLLQIYLSSTSQSTTGQSIIGQLIIGQLTSGQSTTGQSTSGQSTSGQATSDADNPFLDHHPRANYTFSENNGGSNSNLRNNSREDGELIDSPTKSSSSLRSTPSNIHNSPSLVSCPPTSLCNFNDSPINSGINNTNNNINININNINNNNNINYNNNININNINNNNINSNNNYKNNNNTSNNYSTPTSDQALSVLFNFEVQQVPRRMLKEDEEMTGLELYNKYIINVFSKQAKVVELLNTTENVYRDALNDPSMDEVFYELVRSKKFTLVTVESFKTTE